jgi:hypothetical protein
MDKGVARDIRLLEEAVSIVMHRSRKLASKLDSSNDLSEDHPLEDLQQNAIALHYELEALKVKIYRTRIGLKPVSNNHFTTLTPQPTEKEKDET